MNSYIIYASIQLWAPVCASEHSSQCHADASGNTARQLCWLATGRLCGPGSGPGPMKRAI